MSPELPRRRVLLVIPAYDEESRLGPALRGYVDHARGRRDLAVDFLVVLNGCRDGTHGVVTAVAREAPEVSWIEYAAPIGKGGALLAGFRRHAGHDWVGFADADGATSPETLFRLIDEPAEAVMVGRRVTSRRPWGRRVTSLGFNFIVRLLLGIPVRDTQCGAKFFRAAFVPAILAAADTCDMAVDVDLLLAARAAGATVGEREVSWRDQPGSKVRVLRTSSLMFLSVWRLWLLRRARARALRPLLVAGEWLYARIAGRPRTSPPGECDRASLR